MAKKIKTYEHIIKKYNIDVGHQYFVEVPDMRGSVGLADLFAELNFNKGAEIGVGWGEYSEILCKANPNLHLYAVDAWKLSAYPKGFQEDSVTGGYTNFDVGTQEFWEGWHKESVKRLSPYNCTIIRKLSMDALADFEDNSLDFVYLDAGHDFMNFTFDLHHWKDKVRVGGILAGHDYCGFPTHKMIHVKGALKSYMPYYHMLPVFTLSRRSDLVKSGYLIRRDLYGNWFYVKSDKCL